MALITIINNRGDQNEMQTGGVEMGVIIGNMVATLTSGETAGLRSAEDGKPLQPSTGFTVRGEPLDLTRTLAELKEKGAVVYSDVPNLRDYLPE